MDTRAAALVCVIDDDVYVREALDGLFRAEGMAVKTFASAREFLEWPCEAPPACLVVDVNLPGLTGFDLQDRLATAEACIPIVFVTGHGDIPMSVRAMKAGAVEFLTKPFASDELLGAVRQGMARNPGAQGERLSERRRIAQELHDTLLQSLISASMQLHVAAERVPSGEPARESLGRVLELLNAAIVEGRTAVSDLRSSAELLAPEQVLLQLRQQVGVPDHITFKACVEGKAQRLDPFVFNEIYGVAREALTNAVRHSGARSIEVRLEYGPGALCLRVTDDGRGMDPQVLGAGREGHWGFRGMRERAERRGARLTLWSCLGSGTRVELRVPARVAYQVCPWEATLADQAV